MQVETLEQIAERLGWSAERLADARARAAESRPSNVSDSDHARHGSRRGLVTAEEAVWTPSLSPDGKRIAYVGGSSIRIVDVATGESTVVADGLTVEWLGDDRLVIVPG